MLQQTQVKTVVPYWSRWMRKLPTIAALARARPERIHKLWEGLGYYTRVRNMQQAAQLIVREHSGRFPRKFEAVLALPGIGRYTAGAICSIAFNQPHPILDGNVVRVLTRLFGIAGDPRKPAVSKRLWELAEKLVQEAAGRQRKNGKRQTCSFFNQSLMELGATVCTPRQPQCKTCPVVSCCVAYHEGRVGELPAQGRRTQVTAKRFAAFIVKRGSRFLVRQRPAGVVNAHLWEFPNTEVLGPDLDIKQAAKWVLGRAPGTLERLCILRHSITRYRITLEVYYAPGFQAPRVTAGRWLSRSGCAWLAFTSAHKKILQKLDRI
jgi:A/G-specific adenine glycosylase